MKTLKEKISAILTSLGFLDKAKAGTLTNREWEQVVTAYKQEYKTELSSDMANEENNRTSKQIAGIQSILNQVEVEEKKNGGSKKEEDPDKGEDPEEDPDKKPNKEDSSNSLEKISAQVQNVVNENKKLKKQIETIATQTVAPTPKEVINFSIENMPNLTTEKSLFGIDNPIFDMSKRYNKLSANPKLLNDLTDPTEEDFSSFKSDYHKYGESLRSRYRKLQEAHQLDPKKLADGTFSLGTSAVSGDNLGNLADQYLIRRQDALIARIINLRTVNDLFPTQYGIQDRAVLMNAFFDSVSQAYQKGKVFKGGMKIEPQFGYVDDAMMKVSFGSMKEIERMYIGYLNKENSDPMKWSIIEFCLLNMYTQMQQEQNHRHIMGIYRKPEIGVPGHYLNAATGVYYTLARLVHELSLKPNDDDSLYSYDNTTMLDVVKEFVDEVLSQLDENQTLDGFFLYLNANHYTWWLKCLRKEYGKDTDFTNGPSAYSVTVPDTNLHIKWVPNLGQENLMFIQEPGNIEFLENVAGEMLNAKMKDDMEEMHSWSTWKEGCGASYVGPKFTSKEDLDENNFQLQRIFMNLPAVKVPADSTAITADKNHRWYITGKNTKDTSLTSITSAKQGAAYIIQIGDAAFPTKIAKSGSFSEITADFIPTKVGDYIMVGLNSSNKFFEFERQVNGIRAVNKLVQPNIPGVQ